MVRERELLRWVRSRVPKAGDDCAVLDCPPWGTLLLTTDSVIDGVHARWGVEGPELFGYKAVARGMSDVAAMGGTPLWAVLAVCLPAGVSAEEAKAVLLGAERTGCEIVGGDTAFGPTPYVAATVLGRAHAKGPVLRSGARPGDWILVTGPLGGSLANGKHATFVPRVEEARLLMERFEVHAMIDLSDGLAGDLHRILEASGVGCRLDAQAIPRAGVSLEHALNDGEDYELLLTVRGDPKALDSLPELARIGVVTRQGALLIHPDGREEPLRDGGYEHGA
ncbi:MAG: thiamine-phosphate kinase [Planctomycetaceae bacterium]